MRRMIALLLVAATVLGTAACGKKDKAPENPTTAPTEATAKPTEAPTSEATEVPSAEATAAPTEAPVTEETEESTNMSTKAPTRPATTPTEATVRKPTIVIGTIPTTIATAKPTTAPATKPTVTAATKPATVSTTAPAITTKPTAAVTVKPTAAPTAAPTTAPTTAPVTIPVTKPVVAKYDASQDAPFLPKDIFSSELYAPGIVLGQSGQNVLDVTNQTNVGAFVFKGEYGKCYEVKIPAGVPCAAAVRFSADPCKLSPGQQLTGGTSVKSLVQKPSRQTSFMYVCRTYGEYLVIYTGNANPIYIGERTIVQQTDTQGPWYIPEPVGSIIGDKKLGDANWRSEAFFDNMYEPLRKKYPDYISRSSIGKDATGKYDMYCYVYEPENYKTTMFLVGGTHGDEIVGYFALAKTMQLIADATPEDVLLYELRQKVRFVVIPIVNVWSVSNSHTRANGNGSDLNRDYQNLTQQESKNVMACFDQYAKDVSVVMDFHIANACPVEVAMYFNFINFTDNAVANYKTTNHMYHRYKELGHAGTYTDLSRVPGSYTKGSQYFEGRIWNQYGVPTITVEYLTTRNFPQEYSDKCMTLAVETYMNFIIQNGLFYIQEN